MASESQRPAEADSCHVAVVSAGIGAEADRQTAADMTLSAVHEALRNGTGNIKTDLGQVLVDVNAALVRHTRTDRKGRFGSSVVIAFRQGSAMVVKSVGDCRAYLWKNGRLRQLTSDHSLQQLLTGIGQSHLIGPESPIRGDVLLTYLGCHDFVPNDEYCCFEVCEGDRMLLCNSDLTARLDDTTICAILNQAQTPDQAVEMLSRIGSGSLSAVSVCCVCLFFRHPAGC